MDDDAGGVDDRPQGMHPLLPQALRNFCGDIVDRQLAAACLGNCALNNCTNGVLGKALSRGFYFWQLEQLIHAGNIPTGIGAGCRGGRGHCGIPPCARMAETDRNRTCQTDMRGLTGFQDRGAHQDTYASVCSPYTRIPRRQYTCHPYVHQAPRRRNLGALCPIATRRRKRVPALALQPDTLWR